EVVTDLASELEQIAHAERGDEPGTRALLLEHRVDANGRAVTEIRHRGGPDAVAREERVEARRDADRLIGRRRRAFLEAYRAVPVVHGHEIRERAADVDAHSPCHGAQA